VPYLGSKTHGVYFSEPYGENAITGNQLFGFHNSFSLLSTPLARLGVGKYIRFQVKPTVVNIA
jgi:hypothetical protein